MSALGDRVSDPVKEAYRSIVLTRKPVLLEGWFEGIDLDAFRREVLLLPLGSSDQCVEYVLSAGVYERSNPIASKVHAVAELVAA